MHEISDVVILSHPFPTSGVLVWRLCVYVEAVVHFSILVRPSHI